MTGARRIDGGGQDIRAQDHAGAAASGCVIDAAVLAVPELADIKGL
jgi:hypothetical protein